MNVYGIVFITNNDDNFEFFILLTLKHLFFNNCFILNVYIMASTRNKNTKGNYELENNQYMAYLNTNISDSRIYMHNYLPGEGLLPGSYPLNILANQHIDIETNLLGIGSTSLITNNIPIINKDDIRYMKSLNISYKLPLVLPDPLVIKVEQRPFW